MKKNTMMRIASFLLIAVLLSTSAISGTYAKYVTADDASDSARVAKWGVVASVDGTLFYDAYQNTKATWIDKEKVGTITVQAATKDEKVVAPGTKNEEGLTIVLSGAPEVDVDVKFTFTATSEIHLDKNVEYTDFTHPSGFKDGKPVYDTKFKLANDYYPVVFILTKNGAEVARGNVNDIQTYLTNQNGIYHTNTGMNDVNGTYVLTWEWIFSDTADNTLITDIDRADTYLGNETTLQNIDVTFSLSVTQVD